VGLKKSSGAGAGGHQNGKGALIGLNLLLKIRSNVKPSKKLKISFKIYHKTVIVKFITALLCRE